MSNITIETQQILVEDLRPGMAFLLGGALWAVDEVCVNWDGDRLLTMVDPHNFVDSRPTMTLDRRLGIEIVTKHGCSNYAKSDRYEEVSASDKALDDLRFKLTGTRRLPEPKVEEEPLAQWEKNLLAGRDANDDGSTVNECCVPETSYEAEMMENNPCCGTNSNPGDAQDLTSVETQQLCYDDWTGRFFRGTLASLEVAMHRFNSIVMQEGEADLNTFYDLVELSPTPMGVDFGWNEEMKLIFGTIMSPEGKPAIAISFRNEPKPALGYGR